MVPVAECRRVAAILRALPGHPEERERLMVTWCSASSLAWFVGHLQGRREAMGWRLAELDRGGVRGLEQVRREIVAKLTTLDAALAALEG
jgi:hypothetical protein